MPRFRLGMVSATRTSLMKASHGSWLVDMCVDVTRIAFDHSETTLQVHQTPGDREVMSHPSIGPCDAIQLSVTVRNDGPLDGDEVWKGIRLLVLCVDFRCGCMFTCLSVHFRSCSCTLRFQRKLPLYQLRICSSQVSLGYFLLVAANKGNHAHFSQCKQGSPSKWRHRSGKLYHNP